jgi:23S rRNA pseudouridine2605 synthase
MRALSKLGVASRVEAEGWIRAGKVKVHGSVETDPMRMVNPDRAHIEIIGNKVKKAPTRIVLFYKPTGVLTSKRDPEGRKTIYDLLPESMHTLHPVGRLDLHTSGLLILTNDTKLSSFLTNPESDVERHYIVRVKGRFLDESAQRIQKGVLDEGELLLAKRMEILKTSAKESTLKMILTQGKNREVRRLCLAVGNEVISLKRVAYGPFELGGIRVGTFLEVDLDQVRVAGFLFNDRIKK